MKNCSINSQIQPVLSVPATQQFLLLKNMDFEMFEIQHITEQLNKLLPDTKKYTIFYLSLLKKLCFSS